MPLPTFEKQDQIPKGFEEEYEESEGKWVPIDRTASLQRALSEEREARKAADALAKKATKEANDLANKKAASSAGLTDKELRDLYDKIESQIREEYEPKVAELETIRGENRAMKLNDRIKQMFTENGALKTRVDDLWKLHGEDFDLTADGKPMVKNEPGKDPVRHVQAILKSRMDWVQGTKGSGGKTFATTTTPTSTPSPNGLSFEDMVKNPSAAIAIANEA